LTSTYQKPKHGFQTFLIVWLTQSASSMGSSISFFAIMIYLTLVLYPNAAQKPQLAIALTAVSLGFTLVSIVVTPIAGVWADRRDRKRMMLICDFASGFISLAMALLMLRNELTLWLLVLLIAASSALGAFHDAAFNASYVMIVPEKQLARANGMMQTMWSLSKILTPAVAALLISIPSLIRGLPHAGWLLALGRLRDGTPIAMGVDAITFFGAAITLLFLFIPSPLPRYQEKADSVVDDLVDHDGQSSSPEIEMQSTKRRSVWTDVRFGLTYILNRRPLLWLLATFTVGNFASSTLAVFPVLLLKYNLHASLHRHGYSFEGGYALLNTVESVGGLLAGILMSTWGGSKRKRVLGVLIPMFIEGLAQVTFGLSTAYYLTLAMVFLMAAMVPLLNTHSQTIWQMQTPVEIQGRVFSIRRVIAQFTFPFGTLLAGWTASFLNPGIAMACVGAILSVVCVLQMFNPTLRKLDALHSPILDSFSG